MMENANADLTPRLTEPETDQEEVEFDEPNGGKFDDFLAATDEHLAEVLTPDVVAQRLAQLKSAEAERSSWHDEDWRNLLEPLTAFAFQVVRSWIAIIATIGGPRDPRQLDRMIVTMAVHDVDELTEDVISRAINGFREELSRLRWWLRDPLPDMKTLFLLECAIQLPDAFRGWQLSRGRLSWDELDELAEFEFSHVGDERTELIGRICHWLTGDPARVTHVLRTVRYSDAEIEEILDATNRLFDLLTGQEPGPTSGGVR